MCLSTVLYLAALETTQSELFELKNKYDDGAAAKYVCHHCQACSAFLYSYAHLLCCTHFSTTHLPTYSPAPNHSLSPTHLFVHTHSHGAMAQVCVSANAVLNVNSPSRLAYFVVFLLVLTTEHAGEREVQFSGVEMEAHGG